MHLATDVGGTFTDFVIQGPDRLETFKLPSLPDAPDLSVHQGLEYLRGLSVDLPGRLQLLSHASTVATNALLERKGARVALVTTQGFSDLLHIGRQTRPDLYDLAARRPPPLVDSDLCFEVRERIGPKGDIIRPLETATARRVLELVQKAGADSLAVCLLHSYVNDSHERLLQGLAEEVGLACSLSSQVWPEFREFERASTTVADAYLRPVLVDYIQKLGQTLRRQAPSASWRLMGSAGALIPVSASGETTLKPVDMLLSGPAGGVMAASRVARTLKVDRMLTLDMGGTSTDVALLHQGVPQLSSQGEVAGLPLRLPRVNIETVGAGGGSIACVGPSGMLQVGPISAGAEPGPACYGKGGQELTVTDALLLVGWLPPLDLPGQIQLNKSLAEQAAEPLVQALGLKLEELALGVISVALATMLRPLEALTLRQGHDPRDFTLLAFGGAGPLVGCAMAERLGSSRVIVPLNAGVFSALGLALAPVRFHGSRAIMRETAGCHQVLSQAQGELEEHLGHEAEVSGLKVDHGQWKWILDLRYVGQSHELALELSDLSQLDQIPNGFAKLHARTNGYALPDQPVEIIALRGSLEFPPARFNENFAQGRDVRTPKGKGRVFWEGEELEALRFDRASLGVGGKLDGPAIILESGATTFLPPDWSAVVTQQGHLLLEVEN